MYKFLSGSWLFVASVQNWVSLPWNMEQAYSIGFYFILLIYYRNIVKLNFFFGGLWIRKVFGIEGAFSHRRNRPLFFSLKNFNLRRNRPLCFLSNFFGMGETTESHFFPVLCNEMLDCSPRKTNDDFTDSLALSLFYKRFEEHRLFVVIFFPHIVVDLSKEYDGIDLFHWVCS